MRSGSAQESGVRVVILDNGPRRSEVLRIVRGFTDLDPFAAADLIDRPLTRIDVWDGEPRAQGLAFELGQAGATVVIEVSGDERDEFGDLERLAALHQRGVIDDDEFAAAKRRVLDRI